uniref:Zinc finger and BTB domain-containing protein 49 n=2 Tax=Cacopsylla melanoneura TaxID=428564 RepID=A0A8D8QVV4_9HEMI
MDYSGTVDYDVNTPFKYEGDEAETVPQSDEGGVDDPSRVPVHHHQDDLIYPPLDFATPTPQAMDNPHSVPSSNTHLLDSQHTQSLGDSGTSLITSTNSHHLSNNISRSGNTVGDTTTLTMETESIVHETENQPPSSPESEDMPLARRTAPARRGRGRPARSTRTNKSFAEADDEEEEEFDQKPPKGLFVLDSTPSPPLLGTQSIFSSLVQKERRTQLTKGAKKKKKTEPEFCRFCFTNELSLQKVRTVKLPSTSSHPPNTKFTSLVPSVIESVQLGLNDKWTNPSFGLVCDECVQVFSSFAEFRTNVETNDALLRKLYCKSKAKSKKPPPSAPVTPTPTPPPSSGKGGKRGKAKPDPSSADDSEAVSTVSTKQKKPGRRGRPPKASAVTDDDDYETDGYLSSVSKTSRKSTTSRKGSKKKRGVTTDDDTDGYLSSVSRKSTTVTNTSAAAKNAKKKRRYNSDSDNEDVKSDVSDGMDFGGPTPYDIKQEKMSEDEDDGGTVGNYDQDYDDTDDEIEDRTNRNNKLSRKQVKQERRHPHSLSIQYGWNRTFTKMIKIERKTFGKSGGFLGGTKPDQEELGVGNDEEFFNLGKLGARTEVYSEDEGGDSSGDETESGRNKGDQSSRGVGREGRKYLFIRAPFTGVYCKDIPLSRTGMKESSADLVWNRTHSKLVKRSEVRLGERKPKEPEVEEDVLAEREQEREKARKPVVGYEPAEERYPCRLCDVVVTKYMRLVSHLREVHNEKPEKSVICYICAKTFTTLKTLSQHLRRQHGDEPKEICEICSAEVSNMAQHKITHQAPRLRCEFCSKPFRRNMDLKYHVRAVHSSDASTLVACEVCGKTFGLESYLKRHMRTHTQAKPYKCVCGEGYNFNVSLKAHKVKCAVYLESVTGEEGN